MAPPPASSTHPRPHPNSVVGPGVASGASAQRGLPGTQKWDFYENFHGENGEFMVGKWDFYEDFHGNICGFLWGKMVSL